MRDAAALERRGKPTITLAHDKFERAARAPANRLGMPGLLFLIEPTPKGGHISSDVRELALTSLDLVIRSLTSGQDVAPA